MSSKSSGQNSRNSAHTSREGENRVHVKENYFRHVDQMERWRQEYDHQQAVESKLVELSKIRYERVEYEQQLEKVPWKDRPIPDYSYLLEKARLTAEKKFFYPVAIHIVLLLVLIIALFIGSSLTALWIGGTVGIAVLASLHVTIKKRQQTIELSVFHTQTMIEQRVEYERQLNEAAKLQHETKENERVAAIEHLLAGNVSAVFYRLDLVLPSLALPFLLDVDIEIYNQIPLVKIWLPPKTIIPSQLCTLLPSGRVSYQDKDTRASNKQYLELCAAVMMQIIAIIYANIPTVDRCYCWGISKDGMHNDCVIEMSLDREILESVCSAANGLAAIQQANARFEFNTSLNFEPIEVTPPEEWGEVEQQFVRCLHVKLHP